MKTIILSLFLLLAQPAFALLSPLNQSVAELQDIVDSDDLTKKLPTSQKIESITAVDNGYIIHTQEYQMLIEVQYQPQNRPGPVHFQLIFHEPTKYQR